MTDTEPVVFIIDDDVDVRSSLENLLRSVGLRTESFASPTEFLQAELPDVPSCLVLDIRFAGQERSGLDFQRELQKGGLNFPVVFITGHGDIPLSVQAMKSGAIEFLTKPFREQELLDAIRSGIDQDRRRLETNHNRAPIHDRFESLTKREREIFALVVTGRLNKQIAGDLRVSEGTVKVHRGHIMRKMGARSVIDLVRMSDRLRVSQQ